MENTELLITKNVSFLRKAINGFFCEVHEVRVTYKCNTRQVIGNLVML